MLFNIFVIAHVITCFLLIVAVLMQSSKGGGLSGAFGGGGGEAMFGGRETATFLSRATTSLAFLSADRGVVEAESALRKAAQRGERVETVAPEEQKNIEEVLGTLPEPAETGQEEQPEQPPE